MIKITNHASSHVWDFRLYFYLFLSLARGEPIAATYNNRKLCPVVRHGTICLFTETVCWKTQHCEPNNKHSHNLINPI